jgi:hypothetical protein
MQQNDHDTAPGGAAGEGGSDRPSGQTSNSTASEPAPRGDFIDHAFQEGPRIPRPWWIWVSSAVIVIPTVATMAASLIVAFYISSSAQRTENPSVLFGAALFPAPLLLVLLMEQWAVGKRVALSAILLAALFLLPATWLGYATIAGAIRLAQDGSVQAAKQAGLIQNWLDVAGAAAVTGVCVILGLSRLGWWRKILAASLREAEREANRNEAVAGEGGIEP